MKVISGLVTISLYPLARYVDGTFAKVNSFCCNDLSDLKLHLVTFVFF